MVARLPAGGGGWYNGPGSATAPVPGVRGGDIIMDIIIYSQSPDYGCPLSIVFYK